ncbi:MAG TPA: geranylgeranyl reductase family protein, partial [Blastocatellia bacterium]
REGDLATTEHSISSITGQIWDATIVGAGPAGATAAIHLAARGHRVLLIDKENFPRDKVCGDGLIADSIRCLKRAELYEEVRRLGYETSIGSVFSPSRVRFDVEGEFLTLKRMTLDDLIVRKAVERGAIFVKSKVARVDAKEDGSTMIALEGSDENIRARIAILATGASVELPASLGLVTEPRPSAIALRCYVCSPVKIEPLVISYDRSITPGYAWIFPLGKGEYNVGCGLRYLGRNGQRINLKDALRSFLESFPMARELMSRAESITPARGAMLRCGLAGARPKGAGNTLIIGESIGATFPFTGEGIGKAMETGEIAARLSDEALRTGDFTRLGEFPHSVERELKPKYMGYLLAERWLARPWLNDFVARRVSRSPYLQECVSGIVNETIDPREVFSLGGVIRSFIK